MNTETLGTEWLAADMTMEEKNAALRQAVESRLSGCCDGGKLCSTQVDEHPVMADPDDESDDTPDPIHEFRGGWTAEDMSQLLATHETTSRFMGLLEEMAELHNSKSADYGSDTDPLANIRQGAEFVGIEPWRGCMVRIADKVQRLRTYCKTGRLVHEGVRDTLMDLAAYSLLAIILHEETLDE